MKPTLQVRQSQQLKLTPQLRQGFHLLQISTVDLDQEIGEAVDSNPFLERTDDPWRDTVILSSDSSLHYRGSDAWTGDAGATGTDLPANGTGHHESAHPAATGPASPDGTDSQGSDYTEYPADDADDGPWTAEGSNGPRPDSDDDSPGDTFVPGLSLHEHLREQLRGTPCNDLQRQLVDILIEDIDQHGYLQSALSELHDELLAPHGIALDELDRALGILQGFDPAGVGARGPSECLRLQLRELAGEYPADSPLIALASQLVEDDCLHLLADREYDRLRKRLRCTEVQLSEAHTLIRTRLDPHPGNRFSADQPTYVRPDVTVRRRSNGSWQVSLNQAAVPTLRVNPDYARLFKNHQNARPTATETEAQWKRGDVAQPASTTASPHAGETASADDSLSRQLQEAHWMVRNVQQRFSTIQLVSQAIVDRQTGFLERGPVGMQPLVLREIAETTGFSESTISRATTQKYMATPHGVFELKHFFSSHVATESGGAVSSTAICELIRQFIDKEPPTQPLSDNQLTELLGQQGISIARRTVAKYRESIGKPPASQRKAR
ncbi:MAG: RNA polymerase factor sigma-54 [Lautropia sp.]|nr:RNA polymerase factor sigma-54 [Lautropia sp.]